ncbi:hypothetical protein GFK26_12640 [Variovorax paradoxus]|uniref:Uncharacterized protein n=1 Tax=Variovorax paradoxus TaxID=34073 RepID=A0A5Q0M503_VARPD|nr:hypothetical protein [Variovorax paradoxus]QFZ83545.1 hypothetical protein GFK26_12640 [Variovorax paradoxus]
MTTDPINALDQYTSVPSGLVLALTTPALKVATTTLLVKEAATGGQNFGLKLPTAQKVNVFVSGTERQVQQQQALHAGNDLHELAASVSFMPIGLRPNFDFVSQEGIFLMQLRLRNHPTPAFWVFTTSIANPEDPLFVDALGRLRVMAKLANSWIVAILVCEQPVEVQHLVDLSDEFIEFRRCEPNVGGGLAFSIDCKSLEGLEDFGLGKVMCSVRFGQDGRYMRTFEPFIADTLRDRVIRILGGNDYTLADIGAIVDRDKSNVSRRLRGWQPQRIAVSDEWLARVKEHFAAGSGASGESAKNGVSGTKTDHQRAQDALDGIDEEDDDSEEGARDDDDE